MALISKLTAIAEAIRSKTETTDLLTLDEMVGAIESIQSGGGGNLAIKSGKVYVNGGYTFSVAHGCGKLPKWVFIEAPNNEEPVLNRITFAFWQDNYLSFTVRGSTTSLFSAMQMQKAENIAPSEGANAVMVDEEKIVMKTTQTLMATTFTWYAIYEGEQSGGDDWSHSVRWTSTFYQYTNETPRDFTFTYGDYFDGSMQTMFAYSSGIKSLKVIGSKSVIANISGILRNCNKVEMVDFSECDLKLRNVQYSFVGCSVLKTIFGELDFSENDVFVSPFGGCNLLEEIRLKPNSLKLSLSFSNSPKLSANSIQSIIDGLADLTGQTAQTITWHKDIEAKLSEEQKAQITSKNWTIAFQ